VNQGNIMPNRVEKGAAHTYAGIILGRTCLNLSWTGGIDIDKKRNFQAI
jgi:hypothetical protein